MTKPQAMLVKVGDKAWSQATGLGELFEIEAIDEKGPRAPYFSLCGRMLSYHEVTPKIHRREPPKPSVERAVRVAREARDRYWARKADQE